MSIISYSKQSISKEDIEAVINVLKSDWLTQGPAIEQFEKTVADYCGAKYAVAVSSGTAALHIACLAAGLKKGDMLWTSPVTFVASANCALYCGAMPDFVDIDLQTCNMSVEELGKKLASAEKSGRLPKVVIPVHFAGYSCDMKEIYELKVKYNFTIIEDGCHALGGDYRGKKIGSCEFSDITVFSFHPVKTIATGEGGMVLTNDENIYQRLIRLRTHGITRNPSFMDGESHGPWYYQQIELGYNYRITDIQAALGTSQMRRVDEFVKRRNYLTLRYNNLLKDMPLTLPLQLPDIYPACHLYVIRLKLDNINKTHRQVFEELRSAGIGVNLHYIPVHLQPYYQQLGFKQGDFPKAEKYYNEAISLPLYYDLSEDKQDFVVNTVNKLLQ